MSAQPVVWIDPDLDFTLLVRRSFRQKGIQNPIVCLTSGELAVTYLSTLAQPAEVSATPLLISSVVALPEMNGFELLNWIRARPAFAGIPILLLGAKTERDVERARQLGAAGFLAKPSDMNGIVNLVGIIIRTWFNESPY